MEKDIYSNERRLTKYEREYFLAHCPQDIEPQEWVDKAQPFFQELIDFSCYLTKERHYSPCTADGYIRDLNNFVCVMMREFPELKDWTEVEDVHVHSALRRVNKIEDNSEALTARSKARMVSSLKSFYKYEIGTKRVENNFMLNVDTPRFRSHLPQYLSYEQFEKLVALPDNPSPKDYRDRAIIELLFSTGLRISELVGVTLEDLNLCDFEIRVVGKGNKERIVPFGSYAYKAIQRWLPFREGYSPTVNNLFVNRFGEPLNPRAVQIMMKKLGESLALPIHATPHKLRHSFATEMISNGADLRTVQEILGHSSLGTTQLYLHLDTKKLQDNYNKTHPLVAKVQDE